MGSSSRTIRAKLRAVTAVVVEEASVRRSPSSAPPSPDDSELLAALRRGDASVATAFHRRVRPSIDRTLRRLLGARDADLDDLAQLSLIELVSTIGRYRGECSLDAWTTTLTARVVYKEIRRRRSERRLFEGLAETSLSLVGTTTSREITSRSLLSRVVDHLSAMDVGRAWTFVLHDVCGHDLREIAEITGASVAAAQSRLVRGRQEIHERIAEDPELARALDDTEGEP